MRMRTWTSVTALAAGLVAVGAVAVAESPAHEKDLPEGPIRDRHELMEGIGAAAKKIGKATKAGDADTVAEQARAIVAKVPRISGLFPQGSTHEKSRAKPEIWERWSEFEKGIRDLGEEAAALAEVARSGGDVKAASGELFHVCKTCHEAFRVPED